MWQTRGGWWCGSGVACLFVTLAWGASASAIEVVIRGLADPDPVLLARAVVKQESLVRFTAPASSDGSLAKAVEEMVSLALERAGYPEPDVEAAVQRQDGSRNVIVEVTPGRRFQAGDLRVEGLGESLATRLKTWLQTPQPVSDAKPRVVDAGNAREIEWVTDEGRPAKMNPPLWTKGTPAAFDDPFLESVRRSVTRFLQEEGHFIAAERVGKKATTGDACEISIDVASGGAQEASLVLRMKESGPGAVVERVVVEGTDRISADVVGAFLGIKPGQRITAADLRVWEEQLRLSGRFIRQQVSCGTLAKDGSATVVCRLLPHPDITPLGQPLTGEEEVMLRFRSWLMAALGGEGLQVRWVRPEAELSPTLLLSNDHGAVLTSGLDAQVGGLAVTEAGLGLFLPQSGGRFEVPLASLGKAMVHASLSVRDAVDEKTGRYRHDLSLSASFGSWRVDDPAAVVTVRIEPVACLALVHRRSEDDAGEAAVRWDGDVLEVAQSGGRARFQASTGQLLELDLGASGRVEVSGISSWQDEVAALRQAAGEDLYDAAAPASSAVLFFGRGGAGELLRRVLASVGWEIPSESPWPAVARAVQAAAADGGFAEVDRRLAAVLDRRSGSDVLPEIPAIKERPRGADPLMAAVGILSGKLAVWLDGACGGDAWPTALARLTHAVFQQDGPASLHEVACFMASEEAGPLAHLTAASVVPIRAAAASFAMRGQGRVDAAAFRSDCEPGFKILENSGLDRACVSVLRRLDTEAVLALGEQYLGERSGLVAFQGVLVGSNGDEAAVAEMPRAVAAWWEDSLGEIVAAALDRKAGGPVAVRPSEADVRR